jgi:hypothetical protein
VRYALVIAAAVVGLGSGAGTSAFGADGQQRAPQNSAKSAAPVDLTGWWTAVIDTDWRWRMVTPAKGDFGNVPLTAAARKVADGWDPAKDAAAGEQCRAYGAAGLMRIPERLHITWQGDNVLRVDTDAGMQTRLLHFDSTADIRAPAESAWQGVSTASWDAASAVQRAAGDVPQFGSLGSLHVVTTGMRPGYLRKNGVPYSANALLDEDWHAMREDGTDWLVIYTTVTDPVYLSRPWRTNPVFEREPDGKKWHPSPCSSR